MTTESDRQAPDCGAAFDAAATGGDVLRLTIDFAGQALAMRIAGRSAQQAIVPALEHLRTETDSARAGLAIDVWDERETGVRFPAPALGGGDALRNGRIESGDRDDALLGYREHPGTAFRLASRHGWFAFFDADAIPWYERAAPMRDLLNAILMRRGAHIAHTAAVATDGGAALLVGEGGAGKSTTALECLRAGMDYLGDDWCGVESGAQPVVYSLFNSAKLRPDAVEHFREFQPVIHNRDRLEEEKATAYLHRWLPDRLRRSAPVRCILLPRVTQAADTTVEPATARECRDALLPVTLRSTPGCGAASIPLLVGIAHCAPVLRLNLGSDRSSIPGVVARAIRESQAP